MSSSKLDVLAINETELDSYISDSEINLPVFDVARRDRTVNRSMCMCLFTKQHKVPCLGGLQR